MNSEIYALELQEKNDCASIFLAGPTPRDHSASSWRPNMIRLLRELGFTGDIFIPEKRGDYLSYEFSTHTRWEVQHLNKATVILFWIPRDLQSMPAFTTNIEFGEFLHSGKIVLGFPETAEKMRYLKERCMMHQIPFFNSMTNTAIKAIEHSEFLFKIFETDNELDS